MLTAFQVSPPSALAHRPPVVLPADLWKETGRWYSIGAEMGRLKDRNDRDLALAMTHEEAVCDLVRQEIRSYKQMPALIYHIQTKFRDDPRPRAGLILCREEWAKAIDKAVFPGIQGGPLMHIIAAKAVAFHEATQPDFKAYQQRTLDNAQALAAELVRQGLRLVSGGTDNHLMLVDMTPAGVTGKAAEKALDAAGIHTNKNMIPFDPKPPLTASGIRLGTPAATTRGFGPDDMHQVGRWIGEIVHHVEDPAVIERVHRDVIEFACRFPVPA